MLKYDAQLTELKSRLSQLNRILIVLPQNLNDDNLAAGLALSLSLKHSGKKVDVVSTGTPLVSHSNLFGLGDVKNEVSKAGGGNFIISLDGVVDTSGTMASQIPALDKLDWYPEGSKLNLVFHVVPGQRFEPTNIASRHEEAGYDLTVVLGTANLNELGTLFTSNSQYFAQTQVVNIDNNQANSFFGFANIVDPNASSLSEMVAQILPSLTLNMDRDTASNIIAGIYSATNNLTQKINPDTFMAVSQAVQVGGTLPNMTQQPAPVPQAQPMAQPAPQPQYQQPEPVSQSQPQAQAPVPEPVAQPAYQPEPQYQSQPEAPAQNSLAGSPFIVPPQDINIPLPAYQPPAPAAQPEPQFQFSQPQQPTTQPQASAAIPQSNSQGFDLRQIFQIPQMPSGATASTAAAPAPSPVQDQIPTVQQIYQPSGGHEHEPTPQPQIPDAAKVSMEERPMGEVAQSSNPEMESTPTPDWLVPKIFKGGNLG